MMTMIDFSVRSKTPELMDDPSIEVWELEETLDDLARVNAFLGGYSPTLEAVQRVVGRRKALSVLDVGTGCGDGARRLVEWGRKRGVAVEVTGIDVSAATVRHARRRSSGYEEVKFELRDLFAMKGQRRYDIVHAALMLHHLDDGEAVAGLQKMYRLSRLAVVVNDLHRHRVSYLGSRLILPVLSSNRLIRHDGPLSVLRAFTKGELRELVAAAGLPRPEIRWRPLFRWQMVIGREAT